MTLPKPIFTWKTKVEELRPEWEICLGTTHALKSYALQKVVEDSQLNNTELFYLKVEDSQGILALIPCHSFRISLATVARPFIQKLVESVRKKLPQFLYTHLFVVGSALTTCGDLLGMKDTQDSVRWTPKVTQAVFEEIEAKARSLGIGLVLIKELEEEKKEFLKERIGKRYFFADSLPTTILNIAPRERGGYLQSIRTRYRNKLKKRKLVAAGNNLTWEIAESATGLEDQIYGLYEQVVNNSDFVFERLNKHFFFEASKSLKENCFYVFGFQKNPDGSKKLASCEFVLCEKDTMHPLYSGFNYQNKQDSDLYFNAFYAIIEEAERRGFTNIHMGQTAYEVKAELGCQPINLYVGVRHLNPLFHGVFWLLRRLFFPVVKTPSRDVFATPPAPPKTQKKSKPATPASSGTINA